jgi:hypothetical protein
MWRKKVSHMAHKNEPYGIKKRAICYLSFLKKCWYNYLQMVIITMSIYKEFSYGEKL